MFDVHSEFLFPRQVIISKDLEYEYYREDLITYCLNKKSEDPEGQHFTNVYGWQSDIILHDKKLPKIFKERIKQNVFYCLENELNILATSINIHRMWIQISQKNSFNIQHTHPMTHYSGVFYVKTPNSNECGNLTFHPFSDSNHYQPLLFVHDEILKKNNMSVSKTYIPSEGTLFLFPSGLRHSVSVNQTNYDRISIAFDILFER
jgi:uncharacterized protein (TIGR02466 family)